MVNGDYPWGHMWFSLSWWNAISVCCCKSLFIDIINIWIRILCEANEAAEMWMGLTQSLAAPSCPPRWGICLSSLKAQWLFSGSAACWPALSVPDSQRPQLQGPRVSLLEIWGWAVKSTPLTQECLSETGIGNEASVWQTAWVQMHVWYLKERCPRSGSPKKSIPGGVGRVWNACLVH